MNTTNIGKKMEINVEKIRGIGEIRSQKNHPALDKALTYLYNNYAHPPLTLSDIAEQVCMSPSHLSYLFKVHMGMSYKQMLLRIRMVKAMELMEVNPHLNVTQVCDEVGFSDLSFFVRKFKAIVGVSPKAYQAQLNSEGSSPE